jgi:hypothetical protein
MKRYRSFLLATFVVLAAGACATAPAPPKTGIELQAYQAKEFETSKRAAFSATMSVFQDLGFIIDDGDFDTGLITATGPSSREDFEFGDVLSQIFGGVDLRGSIFRRATAFVEKMPSGLIRVRLNFVDNVVHPTGSARQSMPVHEPTLYQGTFEKIDQAIFVRSKST